jgi:hypothetical protein
MRLLALAAVHGVCLFVRSYFTHYAAWYFVSDLRVMVYNLNSANVSPYKLN